MNTISVDFHKNNGGIKPLHGVCCAPYTPLLGPNQTYVDKFFKEAHIPYCRLHDCCGSYGGTHFIDVTNIFHDSSADENNPDNYDFYYSDEYIKAIVDSGCEVYYRLGVTIEWGSKKYTTEIPPDFEKWTRICEHIIMHYNEGWANGFRFGIKYWEIWNEPENPGNDFGPSMWGGTKEEFFELYRISSKYLKSRFPDILVGGYGSCGFYTETRDVTPDGFEKFVPYFTDFLEMVKNENCPLDFFSWHIYTGDVQEVLAHAKFTRETLDKYGFYNTESHLNEWNIHSEGHGFAAKHTLEGASFNAAVLAMLQNTDYVDKAMYYCFSHMGMYNGFLNQNDKSVDSPWYSFVAFGKLYELGESIAVSCEGEQIYASAAKDGDKGAILISNYKSEDESVSLLLKGLKGNSEVTLKLIAKNSNLDKVFSTVVSSETEISFKLCKETIMLVEII